METKWESRNTSSFEIVIYVPTAFAPAGAESRCAMRTRSTVGLELGGKERRRLVTVGGIRWLKKDMAS